jgi:thiol-disulfide isomerase/thioredoxin
VDQKELEFQLLSHPSYPSLHSLTGVLNHFRIENLVVQVPIDKETFQQLPDVFIAYVKNQEYDDLVLTTKKDSKVQVIFDQNRKEQFHIEEFLKLWTGILVGVEKDEESPISKENKKQSLLNTAIVASFIVLLSYFFYLQPDIFQIIHFLLSLAGLAMGTVIVKHELGLQSQIADKFCSGKRESINCDEVLQSKGSKLFNSWNFSDIGITYFSTILLSSLLLLSGQSSYQILILVTALAIPFTFYSIAYQYFVVKKWCLLCLSIVSILWLQSFALYFAHYEAFNSQMLLPQALAIVFSFALCFSLWQFIIRKLKTEQDLKEKLANHNRFKRNYKIYQALTSYSNSINTNINLPEEISFTKGDPHLKIVLVTNPLCGFCKETHKIIEKLIGQNHIQITIRFHVNGNTEYPDTQIASRLLELYSLEGEDKCLQAMNEIYGELSAQDWLQKWGKASDQKYLTILKTEREWCLGNNIEFTPVILVNGKSFPLEYDREDLLYFIDDIIEEQQELIEDTVS